MDDCGEDFEKIEDSGVRGEFMTTKRFYFVVIVFSVFIIVSNVSCSGAEKTWLDVLANISYSALAASFMALYIEYQNEVVERKRIQEIKTAYLKDIYNETIMLIGRAVWFFRQLSNDEFNWGYPIEVYCSLGYAIKLGQGIGENQTISVDDAKKEIDKYICDYGLDNFKHDDSLQSKRIEKLFQILAHSTKYLQIQVRNLERNTLLLALQKSLSVDECKKMMFETSLVVDMMRSKRGNYKTGLEHMFSLESFIRQEGGFKEDISVWLQLTLSLDEL